ncbi:MAG: fumarylacetoacetate hydrolase family protein [Chloroflexaceae bacterium]|nr:fumarylacetoacetate hydrolase family protein [Chloroflexaceae bacterium]
MKLATYTNTHVADPRVGVVMNASLIDVSAAVPDMLTLIEGGAELLLAVAQLVRNASPEQYIPLDHVRLLAPIPRPRKNMVCLGKNYAAHAAETARALQRPEKIPTDPIFFTKSVTAINHPDGSIPYDPAISTQIDWEVELAFIIGQRGKNISSDEAMSYVFGYTIFNDISARDLQSQHRQFFKGKSLDGTAPMGPWIVTPDEIDNPHGLSLHLRVNGQIKQQGQTSDMIFTIPKIIAILSHGMTLEPGDIVATGTPDGVGMAMDPPEYLQPGDTIEAEIEQIGVLRNTIGTPQS